jgi:hypothetical protein
VYEHRHTRPLPRPAYYRRLAGHFLVAVAIICGSLLIGMWGYHALEGLTWLDAFTNAAMLLGGEGPLAPPHTPAGKIFAGLYALYSGILFIAVAGLILAPVVHRLLHRFHWEQDQGA